MKKTKQNIKLRVRSLKQMLASKISCTWGCIYSDQTFTMKSWQKCEGCLNLLMQWKWSGSESCSVEYDSLWPHGLYSSWNFLCQNTGMGSLFCLQGVFPTQVSNPGLLDCRQILYQLSHKGSPWCSKEERRNKNQSYI